MGFYFKQIDVGPMANWAYLVGDASKREVMVVDPAWQIDTLLKIVENDHLILTGILLTHTHFDHCNGIEDLFKKKELPIHLHKEEARFWKSQRLNEEEIFPPLPEKRFVTVQEGDVIQAGAVQISVIHTPGHTPGCQCFLAENHLLTGDTLFIGACGRTDLAGSDPKKMFESLKKLSCLPDRLTVYPGHDYGKKRSALLGEEKESNFYLKRASLNLAPADKSDPSTL
jgi:glyoxylase-like metal-dependent hydrolase (beta-lactamase superfamily II)